MRTLLCGCGARSVGRAEEVEPWRGEIRGPGGVDAVEVVEDGMLVSNLIVLIVKASTAAEWVICFWRIVWL